MHSSSVEFIPSKSFNLRHTTVFIVFQLFMNCIKKNILNHCLPFKKSILYYYYINTFALPSLKNNHNLNCYNERTKKLFRIFLKLTCISDSCSQLRWMLNLINPLPVIYAINHLSKKII